MLKLLILSLLSTTVFSAYCGGSPDEGERTNEFPIYDSTPKFIKSIKNAMLFEVGPPNATFPLVHLWGTPYEVGFAQGTLMKTQVREFVYSVWGYLISEIVNEMGDRLPKSVQELIVNKGMSGALDWTADVTAPFTSQAFYDEVRGLADATGIDYDLLWRLQMFPELTKAQCSFFGAWGSAVKLEGHSYQLRALDFDTTGPFKDFPQITVYHPSDQGHPYAQVSWPGNVGSLSGFSSEQIAISEIGVYFPDESFQQGKRLGPEFPPEKVAGEPWMFILRDVLQFATSLQEAEERITNANRTCNLIIGLGDGELGQVHGCEFSGYVANYYSDLDLLPVNDSWHPVIENVVYNAMDWLCPGYNERMAEQLNKFHGQLDETVVVHDILPTVQTGDLHAVVYDLAEQTMHVSFCRKSSADPSEPHFAYERQFTRLRMKEIFQQEAPSDV